MIRNKHNNINMVHFNARSLRKNMTEFDFSFVKDRIDIDIIMIGETWLYTDEEGFVNIPGFSAFFNSNNEVFNQFNTIIKIAVCYKKPSDNNSNLLAHLDLIFGKYKNIVLMGDINIDLLTDTELSRSYKLMLESNGVL